MALRSMSPRRLANGGLFAARRKEFYDESFGRLDGRMGGWRDVALDGDRRGGGGPAGYGGYQAGQEVGANRENKNQHTYAGTAPEAGCLLARRQLFVGGPNLSLRQSVAEAAAKAGACEATGGRALGHDAGPELHLRAFEPSHQEV